MGNTPDPREQDVPDVTGIEIREGDQPKDR